MESGAKGASGYGSVRHAQEDDADDALRRARQELDVSTAAPEYTGNVQE